MNSLEIVINRSKVLEQPDLVRFQYDLLSILKDVAEVYTDGQGSSLSNHTAERLLASIYYCLDACFRGYSDQDAILAAVKNGRLRLCYQEGLNLVSMALTETEKLYHQIRKDRLEVPHEAYHCTLDEGIGMAFAKYSPTFNAQDTTASIDYPLLFDDMSITGIYYLKNYLETLQMENDFCKRFSAECLIHLLEAYGRIYRINYARTLLNIFEIVLNHSIFSVLSGSSASNLRISPEQFEIIASRLEGKSEDEIAVLTMKAVQAVIASLEPFQPELQAYIERYQPLLNSQVVQALQKRTLDKLIVVQERQETPLVGSLLELGERINDAEFRKLAGSVSKTRKTTDKINLILNSLHSLYDFIDILECDCLYGQEITELFQSMQDMELAMLVAFTCRDDRRNGEFSLQQFIRTGALLDMEWQQRLAEAVCRLEATRLDHIEEIAMKIQLLPGDL